GTRIGRRGPREHHLPPLQAAAQPQDSPLAVDPDLMPLLRGLLVEIERRAMTPPRPGPALDEGAVIGDSPDLIRSRDFSIRRGDVPGPDPEIELPIRRDGTPEANARGIDADGDEAGDTEADADGGRPADVAGLCHRRA